MKSFASSSWDKRVDPAHQMMPRWDKVRVSYESHNECNIMFTTAQVCVGLCLMPPISTVLEMRLFSNLWNETISWVWEEHRTVHLQTSIYCKLHYKPHFKCAEILCGNMWNLCVRLHVPWGWNRGIRSIWPDEIFHHVSRAPKLKIRVEPSYWQCHERGKYILMRCKL